MTRIRQSIIVGVGLSYATNAVGQSTCFDDRCNDSPTYISIMGLGCEGHGFFDCALFIDMGFTRQQVDELIESCPCSCGVPCLEKSTDQVKLTTTLPSTSSPTASPISPSPTTRPSTAQVSPSPTKAPTITPTAQPTSAPVSPSPTMRPSKAPSTLRPTYHPSRAPQSLSPTFWPSSSPASHSSAISGPTSSPVEIRPSQQIEEGTCPAGFSGLAPTFHCKGAIHCSNGVKIFGPMPCLSGTTGSLVFDYKEKMCVLKTDEFVCEQPEDVMPSSKPSYAVVAPSQDQANTRLVNKQDDSAALNVPVETHALPEGASNPNSADISSDDDINDGGEPNFVVQKRSFWNTSISQSSKATNIATPLFVGIIAGVGVLAIVAAAAMLSLVQRIYRGKKRNDETDNLEAGDKVQIDDLDEVNAGAEKKGEDNGIVQILSAFLGSGVNENASIDPDGAGCTIISGASMQSASSKMNSILESSKASTRKAMATIETARQKSFDSTTEQVRRIKKGVRKVAEDPAKAVQDATNITTQDINNCGDGVFHCASEMLCLPNDVQPRRTHNGGPSTKRQKNLQESFFDPDDDMTTVYEDI